MINKNDRVGEVTTFCELQEIHNKTKILHDSTYIRPTTNDPPPHMSSNLPLIYHIPLVHYNLKDLPYLISVRNHPNRQDIELLLLVHPPLLSQFFSLVENGGGHSVSASSV